MDDFRNVAACSLVERADVSEEVSTTFILFAVRTKKAA
jgi:hypothetical protein